MTESYGMNFNMAYTTNKDGKCNIGVHLTDSDGLDINRDVSDVDANKAMNELFASLSKDLITITDAKKLDKEKKEAEKREAEKAEQRKKIDELTKQADALRKQLQKIDEDIDAYNKKSAIAAEKKPVKHIHDYASYLKDLKSIDELFSSLF